MKKIIVVVLTVAVFFKTYCTSDLDMMFDDQQLGLTMEVAAQPVENKMALTDVPALVAGYVYYTHIKPGFDKFVSVFTTQNSEAQVEA